MEKENLFDLVKEVRNNKNISFEEVANRIDVYALQIHKELCNERLNKNNESIEKISLKAYPKIHEEPQREAYTKGYEDALNFKFEDMTVLIDWLKRFKQKHYFEQNCPADIVLDYHHSISRNYFSPGGTDL